ncbi:hypothetical protein SAMN04488025_12711 [Planifilum fulgidum]|uniref:Uncharacterized protein n=2 Tax=Planifilum fulgidum TaxID=201973 RepID=A0A1I2R144_9BACL|nr:hypothetical protein SAMN04488025_12711 [Planifilum fulgidum]
MGRDAVPCLEPRPLDEGIQQKAGRPLKNRQLGDEHAGPIPAELDGAPLAEFPPEISSGKFPHGAEGAGPPAGRLPSMPGFADGSTSDKSGGRRRRAGEGQGRMAAEKGDGRRERSNSRNSGLHQRGYRMISRFFPFILPSPSLFQILPAVTNRETPRDFGHGSGVIQKGKTLPGHQARSFFRA